MTKAERLLAILTYLRGRHRAVRAQQLADHLGVSVRTIYRDIESLGTQGVTIEGEAGVGYRMSERESLPPLGFTADELEALTFGARLVKSCADPELTQAADQALQKIRSVLPSKKQHEIERRRAPLLVATQIDASHSRYASDIRHAIQQENLIRFGYCDEHGAETERRVQPLGLVYWGYCWHLVAWCLLREDYRAFRLDRMEHLALLEQPFCRKDVSIGDYLTRYAPDAPTDFWAL